MSHKQILTKAIEKAIEGGWVNHYEWYIFNGDLANLDHDHVDPAQLIFDHDFAKALWGDGDSGWAHFDSGLKTLPWYKYHLMHMVIADDPIAYLGGHL